MSESIKEFLLEFIKNSHYVSSILSILLVCYKVPSLLYKLAEWYFSVRKKNREDKIEEMEFKIKSDVLKKTIEDAQKLDNI